MNGYSHLLDGSVEAFIHSQRAGDASVMLNEDMGSSVNHFSSSLVTSIFAAAMHCLCTAYAMPMQCLAMPLAERHCIGSASQRGAHGDDFTAFLRLHTLNLNLPSFVYPRKLKL